jgi:hypothetical protein
VCVAFGFNSMQSSFLSVWFLFLLLFEEQHCKASLLWALSAKLSAQTVVLLQPTKEPPSLNMFNEDDVMLLFSTVF